MAKKGELLNPFKIDQWWVIVRLEEKTEAKLDDFVRQKLHLHYSTNGLIY